MIEPKMRRDFQASGGFAVYVADETVNTSTTDPTAGAPAETAKPPATDDDETVPPEGDCEGCTKR